MAIKLCPISWSSYHHGQWLHHFPGNLFQGLTRESFLVKNWQNREKKGLTRMEVLFKASLKRSDISLIKKSQMLPAHTKIYYECLQLQCRDSDMSRSWFRAQNEGSSQPHARRPALKEGPVSKTQDQVSDRGPESWPFLFSMTKHYRVYLYWNLMLMNRNQWGQQSLLNKQK